MKIWAKLLSVYKSSIYDNFNERRGSTKIAELLENVSKRYLDQIDSSETESIFEKGDWRNLIVIDGCRYDLFDSVYDGAEERITLESYTPGFISENFSDDDYSDVVYITGNPHFHPNRFKELTGRSIDDVFHTVFHTYRNSWDEEHGTVMPEAIIEDFLTAKKLFPDKRFIIHFMQPHHPFVNSGLEGDGFGSNLEQDDEQKIWTKAARGKYSRQEIWSAYRDNLEFVMSSILDLSEKLSERTILTSDHGNYVGEGGLWGHPGGEKSRVVRKVPWYIIQE